jgi:hypothetical protein
MIAEQSGYEIANENQWRDIPFDGEACRINLKREQILDHEGRYLWMNYGHIRDVGFRVRDETMLRHPVRLEDLRIKTSHQNDGGTAYLWLDAHESYRKVSREEGSLTRITKRLTTYPNLPLNNRPPPAEGADRH